MSAESRQLALFERLASAPDAPAGPIKVLMILSTPRSGSTLLCNVLNQTGKLGWCEEWFNNQYIQAYLQVMGLKTVTLAEYLTFVARKSVGDTGVWAIHAHIPQLDYAKQHGVDYRRMLIDRTVWVKRYDTAAQCVSFAVAKNSERWRSDEAVKEDAKPVSLADYFDALKNITLMQLNYEDNYAKPSDYTAAYETFSEPGHTLLFNTILGWFGKEPQESYPATIQKMRTPETEKAADYFRGVLRRFA